MASILTTSMILIHPGAYQAPNHPGWLLPHKHWGIDGKNVPQFHLKETLTTHCIAGGLVEIKSPVQATDWLKSKGKKMKAVTAYLTEKKLISDGKKRDCRVEYGSARKEFKHLRPKINLYVLAVAALANIGKLEESQTISCFVEWLASGLKNCTAQELLDELEVWVHSLVQKLAVSELHMAMGFIPIAGQQQPPTPLLSHLENQEDSADLTHTMTQAHGQLNTSNRQLSDDHTQPPAQPNAVNQPLDPPVNPCQQLPNDYVESAAQPAAQMHGRPILKRKRSCSESLERTAVPRLAKRQVCLIQMS